MLLPKKKKAGVIVLDKWAVIYSSVTGNTKRVAEKICEVAVGDLFNVNDNPPNLENYDIVALGYWLKRGGPDPLMKNFLPTVRNARVVLFETHGADDGSEHAVTAFARAAYLLGAGCDILGTFDCQGRVNPALIEKRKAAGLNDPHNSVDSVERWERASTHPDADDLERAAAFVEKINQKLSLRRQYSSAAPVFNR